MNFTKFINLYVKRIIIFYEAIWRLEIAMFYRHVLEIGTICPLLYKRWDLCSYFATNMKVASVVLGTNNH